MKKKIFSIMFALVLVVSFSLVTAVPAQANGPYDDTYVDDDTEYSDTDGDADFETIQAAINNTNPGGTVNVAAGTYADIDIVDKSLILQGHDNPTIDGLGTAWGTIFVMGHDAEAVTIDGFTIINSNIDGIHSQEGSTTALTIKNNIIKNNNRDGIEIHGTKDSSGADGNTITGNTITDNAFNGIALEFSNSNTVTNNDCYNNGRSGIYLWSSCTNTITYNNIHQNDWLGVDIGEYVPSGGGGNPITGNHINYNSISGNLGLTIADGVNGLFYSVDPDNTTPEDVDAAHNWWGATNGPSGQGPGDGDAVSENVLFEPWLDSPIEPETGAVSMTAASEEAFIGISVSPTFIDFGNITSGAVVSGDALTVKNTGNVRIMVDAEMTADTKYNASDYFYTAALTLAGCPSDRMRDGRDPTELGKWVLMGEDEPFGPGPFWVNESRSLTTMLECPPVIYAATTYEGTLVFWAEQP